MKIITFVNHKQLGKVLSHPKLANIAAQIKTDLIVSFDEKTGRFSSEYTANDIILVRDDLSEIHPSLQKLISEIEGQEVCILHHSSPSVHVIEKFSPLQTKKGWHSNDPDSLYRELFAILFSDRPSKLQTLIQELFPGAGSIRSREKILLLLHDCLHPSSAAHTDTSWLSPQQKALVQSIALEKDNFGQAYIIKLTQLRESMLETK